MPAAKEGEKEPKIIEFEVPVLRSLSGSDSLEFLINVAWEFVPGERIYVSNLQEIILEEIRGSENVFDIPPHSAISVTVYQVRQTCDLARRLILTLIFCYSSKLTSVPSDRQLRPSEMPTRWSTANTLKTMRYDTRRMFYGVCGRKRN